jgi:hypothetical protein
MAHLMWNLTTGDRNQLLKKNSLNWLEAEAGHDHLFEDLVNVHRAPDLGLQINTYRAHLLIDDRVLRREDMTAERDLL